MSVLKHWIRSGWQPWRPIVHWILSSVAISQWSNYIIKYIYHFLNTGDCWVKTYNYYVVLVWHWISLFSRLLRIFHMQSLNKTIISSENEDFIAGINHFCTLKQHKYLFNRHEHVFHCTRAFLIYVYYEQLSVGIEDRMV